MPIVGVADITKWTGFSNTGSYKALDRLEKMNILVPMKKGDSVYGQKWIYSNYMNLFFEDSH